MTGELANDARRPFPSPAMSEVSADTAMPGDPAHWETVPVLSVIIPVYNEVQTIGRILIEVAKPLPEVPKQIVIVDDRSSDGTSDWLRKNLGQSEGVGAACPSTLPARSNCPLTARKITPEFHLLSCFTSATEGKAPPSEPVWRAPLAMSSSSKTPTLNTIRTTGLACFR